MDNTDPEIVFDEQHHCNHCNALVSEYNRNYADPLKNAGTLSDIIEKVREAGKGHKYDCIIGLSGGVDSSYLAYRLVKDYQLRPLAVHIDNGWNSEKAVSNINELVSQLGIDLVTHVIDWEDFKELQRAFLKASVVDLELLSDHAISVIISRMAKKYRIRYFLIGANFQTESILPSTWFYADKLDSANIRDIVKTFGTGKHLKTYPFLSLLEYTFFGLKYGKWLMPLSYMDYNKEAAKKELIENIGWKDYGGKHHESFITKFYQTYILPVKFNIDKRKAHFSNLIAIGQMSREEALNELQKPQLEKEAVAESIAFFCKKLDMTRDEFEQIMVTPRRDHAVFKTYKSGKEKIWKLIHRIRPSRKRG